MRITEQFQRGFHLIELLVTLVIVGILAIMAVPIYSRHIETASRDNAIAALSKLALAMEEYHLAHNTYRGVSFDAKTSDGRYQIDIQLDGESYVLSATKVADSTDVITLDSSGKIIYLN